MKSFDEHIASTGTTAPRPILSHRRAHLYDTMVGLGLGILLGGALGFGAGVAAVWMSL